jgi:diaminopimelate decarboxylase
MDIPKELFDEPTPFLVCSKELLRKSVSRLQGLGAQINYSVKTNPSKELLELLVSEKVGFSVSSTKDLELLLKLGATSKNIIYHDRALTVTKLKEIREKCSAFVADNESSAINALQVLQSGDLLILRMKASCLETAYSGEYRPGMDKDGLLLLAQKAKAKSIRVGLLHHSSSQMDTPKAWAKKFKEVSEMCNDFDFEVVDLGGGFPVAYANQDYSSLFKDISFGISQIKKMYQHIIIEPGRAIAATPCMLITRVALLNGTDAILDASLYNTHIDSIITGINLPCRSLNSGDKRNYRLLGSSLCNLDVFAKEAKLPELDEGDIMIFDNAGAYNFSSDFTPGEGVKIFVV